MPLCNAIVWDDARTNGVVRHFESKLEEEGLEIDEEDVELEGVPEEVEIGTGTDEAAIGKIEVEGQANGVVGAVGQAMESLGLAGRGKEGSGKRRRKGKEGLVDVYVGLVCPRRASLMAVPVFRSPPTSRRSSCDG